jgi:hypothetical protein
MRRKDYGVRHASCGWWRLHTVMDATTNLVNDADLEIDRELETWDWARAAGVSADELRLALQASSVTPELRKAA